MVRVVVMRTYLSRGCVVRVVVMVVSRFLVAAATTAAATIIVSTDRVLASLQRNRQIVSSVPSLVSIS